MLTSVVNSVEADDTVTCKHGQTECIGNMLAACAASLYPDNVVISLGFANCIIGSYREIPQRYLIEGCALEHGVDFQSLNKCVSEAGDGALLLKESVMRSSKAGVTKSCTVRVDDNMWCIRDDGEWKDCPHGSEVKDLVGEIERLWRQQNPI
jgi:hypothetical protein